MGFLVELGLLQRDNLLGEHEPLLRTLGLERLQALLHRLQIMPQPHAAHAIGEIVWPCFFSSLATRTCPNAGFSMAISTTAFSIAR